MSSGIAQLSERERQVLGLAAIGFTDKEIGVETGVSVHTLRTYWDRIRNKIGDLSRPALVAAFVADQLVGKEIEFFEKLGLNGWVMEAKSWLVSASDDVNEGHGLATGVRHHQTQYTDNVHPDDLKEYLLQVARVQSGESPALHVVCRNVLRGGVETVNTTLIGVKDKEGEVQRVYGTNTESTQPDPPGQAAIRMGRFQQRFPDQGLAIDPYLASILGVEGEKSLDRAKLVELFGKEHVGQMLMAKTDATEGEGDAPEEELKVTLASGKTLQARTWRRIAHKEDGTVEVFGFLAVAE